MIDKGEAGDLEGILERDQIRRDLLKETDELKQIRNRVSKEIGKAGADSDAMQGKKDEMREVSLKIKTLDDRLRQVDFEMEHLLLGLPNIPDDAVPRGKDEADNIEIRRWGEPPQFNFEPQAHWDLGANLDIIDFPRAGKIDLLGSFRN